MTHLLICLVGTPTGEIKERIKERQKEMTRMPLAGLLAHIGVKLLPKSHMRRTSQRC